MQLALGVPNTLTYALSACLVALLALAPGLPLAAGLGRRAEWDLPAILCASFALQLGVVGLVALAAHYLGLSLAFVGWASLAVLLGSGAVALGGRPRDWRPALGVPALVIGAVSVALSVAERTWFAQMADAFYHLAAVRSLLVTGQPMVTDPMFRTGLKTLDPTSGVWHTTLALWSGATGLDVAAWLWPGAAAVGGALTVMSLWVLAKAVGRSERAATIATAAFLVIGLGADLRWAPYPNRLSLALAFVTLAAITSLAVRPNRQDAILVVLAGFATIAMHLAAAEMVVAAAAVLFALMVLAAIVRGVRDGTWRWQPVAALAGAGATVAALAVPLVMPKAAIVNSSWLVPFQSATLAPGLWHLPFGLLIDSPGHLMKVGPAWFVLTALVGVAALVQAFRSGDTHTTAAAALVLTPALLLTDPLVTPALLHASLYLAERVAILLPFTAFVAVAWALGEAEARAKWRTLLTTLTVVLLAAAAVTSVIVLAGTWRAPASESVWQTRLQDVRTTWGADTMKRLSAEFGSRYPIVAGDTMTTYYLAGLQPVAVVAVTSQHMAFAIEGMDGRTRRKEMETLMQPQTAEGTRRAILAERHADYVIVPKYRPALAATLAEMRTETGLLQPVVDTPSLVLFRVKADAGATP